MLQTIRDKSSGWFAGIILGLIILTMAFFGVDSYFAPKIETYSAKIEGPAKFPGWGGQRKEISQDDFRRRLEQARQAQRRQQGEAFDALAFESIENKRELLDGMIDEELALLAAQRDGVAVSESALNKAIMEIDAFKVEGKYNKDQAAMVLQTQGYTASAFKQLMRDDLARQAISAEIGKSGLSSEAEVEAYARLSQQKRDLRWLELPTPSLPEAAVTDEQLQAWHDSHAAQYQREETVAIEYVELDGATVGVPSSIDEATLRDRYEQQRARYVTEPQYLASHILIAVPENADAAAESAARDRAADIVNKARVEGEDFAQLAMENSDDLGSKAEGGDLGAIEKGVFDPTFESAVFALQAGEVSEPVRGAEGWHVIKLRELVAGSARPFEEVRAELELEALETERERAFSELSGRLVDLVYKDPTALAPAAQELGLSLATTGAFARDHGEGIASIEAIRRAAFSDTQKIERQVSDAIEIGPNHIVVLRVTEHQAAEALPLAQVRERVLADFNADRLATLAREQAKALHERAQAGETLDVLAGELGRSVQSEPGVTRFARNLPSPLISEGFRLARPTDAASEIGLARSGNDRYALVAVDKVTDGDLAEMDEATRTLMRQQLAQARGMIEMRSYLQALRQQYTVTVAEDRL